MQTQAQLVAAFAHYFATATFQQTLEQQIESMKDEVAFGNPDEPNHKAAAMEYLATLCDKVPTL